MLSQAQSQSKDKRIRKGALNAEKYKDKCEVVASLSSDVIALQQQLFLKDQGERANGNSREGTGGWKWRDRYRRG